MSTGRRAFDIIRGYVNHGWDQIQGNEESNAEREFREAMASPGTQSTPTEVALPRKPEAPMTLESAQKLLGLSPNATSKQIQSAHDELRGMVDPTKFPEGSLEQLRAKEVVRRLTVAKQTMEANVDPTVKRFERLEID